MDEISCLVFDLEPYRYAVESAAVVAVVALPALQPGEQSPAHVIGFTEWEGRPVPVMDLDLLLGHPAQSGRATDQLIVIRGGERLAGVLAHTVMGTRILPGRGSIRTQEPGATRPHGWRFVTGLVAIEHAMAMLLDSGELLAELDPSRARGDQTALAEMTAGFAGVEGARAPGAGPAEEPGTGADPLAESLFEELSQRSVLALIEIGGQRYGVRLHQVEEFTELERIVPLPGCPGHIWGQTVKRGEIVTVVDVRPALGLECAARRAPVTVVLLRQEEERIGIVVDEVREMVTVRGTLAAGASGPPFVSACLDHDGEQVPVLDLCGLLQAPQVVVEQNESSAAIEQVV